MIFGIVWWFGDLSAHSSRFMCIFSEHFFDFEGFFWDIFLFISWGIFLILVILEVFRLF